MADDLTRAIQAATGALEAVRPYGWRNARPEDAARVAVEAAAPHLHADLRRRLEQADRLRLEAEAVRQRDEAHGRKLLHDHAELRRLALRCVTPYVPGGGGYTQDTALYDLEAWLRDHLQDPAWQEAIGDG